MGRAILAFSPPSLVDSVVAKGLKPYTRSTATSPDRFRSALAVIRLTHVALTRSEFETDTSTVAMPVFAPDGEVAAALELTVIDLRHDLHRSLSALELASRSLTRELAAPMLPIQRFTPVARTGELQLTSILTPYWPDRSPIQDMAIETAHSTARYRNFRRESPDNSHLKTPL